MNSYNRCRKLRARPAAHMRIEGFIGDGVHDTYACYKALAYLGALPFIPLNSRAKRTLPGPSAVAPDGTPICPSGNRMRYYGRDMHRMRLKWRCPKIYGSRQDKEKITCLY
ncbi:MAG: hypothetical protein AB1700_00340 [Bacillota bacterium]